MLSVRKQDPLFVNFVPRTAEEAVDRYIRCKRRGLQAYLIPECLIECAQALDCSELEKFESWIVNPQGEAPAQHNLVETKQLTQSNEAIFNDCAKRIEQSLSLRSLTECEEKTPEPDSEPEALLPSDR